MKMQSIMLMKKSRQKRNAVIRVRRMKVDTHTLMGLLGNEIRECNLRDLIGILRFLQRIIQKIV